jgi:hypothetical protein
MEADLGTQAAAAFAHELNELCRKHGIAGTVRVELPAGGDHEFPGLNDAERIKWVFRLMEFYP